MMKKEARIVMPHTKLAATIDAHSVLSATLTEAFGGVTVHTGIGGWKDSSGEHVIEDVSIYDVAMEDTDQNAERLMQIALEAGKALDQQSVYVRLANGAVIIEDVAKPVTDKADRLLDALVSDSALEAAIGAAKTNIGMMIAIGLDEHGKIVTEELGDKVFEKVVDKPRPGDTWSTRGGGRAFVGKRATIHGGGFNVTLTENQMPYRVGFEYAVGGNGQLYGEGGPHSSLDLIKRIA